MTQLKENQTITNTKKSYRKLGFSHLETAEVIVSMKRLMMDYQVHYHKLRSFHWNVDGPDFFELHEAFEADYNTVKSHIDILAERMRAFGIKPAFTMKETIETAGIEEVSEPLSAIGMVREVLKDFEKLHDDILDVLNISLNIGDVVTEQIMTDFMRHIEKRNWMYTSWCK